MKYKKLKLLIPAAALIIALTGCGSDLSLGSASDSKKPPITDEQPPRPDDGDSTEDESREARGHRGGNGQRPDFRQNRPDGQNPGFGQNDPGGQNPGFGQRRPDGEKSGYGKQNGQRPGRPGFNDGAQGSQKPDKPGFNDGAQEDQSGQYDKRPDGQLPQRPDFDGETPDDKPDFKRPERGERKQSSDSSSSSSDSSKT